MYHRLLKLITAAAVIATLTLGAALVLAEDAPAAKAEAKGHAFVGSKACKMCHQSEAQGKIWDSWLASKHAKSMESLKADKGETTNAKCLKCHTTGYGTDSGYDKVPAEKQDALNFGAVGCESCHGAGADYKAMSVMKNREQALAAGMVMPTAETCKRCHNADSPTFKGFDFDKAYAQIAHKIPKAAEGK
jgi:cytochrome c2